MTDGWRGVAAVAALALLGVLAGCGGLGGAPGGGDDAAPPPLVDRVPADADALVAVNASAVDGSLTPAVRRYVTATAERPGQDPLDGALAEARTLRGTNLSDGVDRVLAFRHTPGSSGGGPTTGDTASVGVLVRADWTPSTVEGTFRSLGRSVTAAGDPTVYEVEGDRPLYVARYDERSWVLSHDRAVVERVLAGNATLDGEVRAAYDDTREDAAVRYAATVSEGGRAALGFAVERYARLTGGDASGLATATTVAGSFDATPDGVRVSTLVTLPDEATASGLAERLDTTPVGVALGGGVEGPVSETGRTLSATYTLGSEATVGLVERRLERGVVAVAPLPDTETLLGTRRQATTVDAVPANVSGVATVDGAVLDDDPTRRLVDAALAATGEGDVETLRQRARETGVDLNPDGVRRVTLFARTAARPTVGDVTTDRAYAGALVVADWAHEEVVTGLRAADRVETTTMRGATVYAVSDGATARTTYVAEYGRDRWVVATNRTVVADVLGVSAGTRSGFGGPLRQAYERPGDALVRGAVRVPASVREVIRTRYGDRAGRLDAFAAVERVAVVYDTAGEDLRLQAALVTGGETDATRVRATTRTYLTLLRQFADEEVRALADGVAVESDGATVTVDYRVTVAALVATLDGG